MKAKRTVLALALLAVTLGAVILEAQRGRPFGGGGRFGYNAPNFGNVPPDTEFVFARLHYTAGCCGGGGWAHDFPTAEEHILQIMREATGLNVERMSYKVVELGSPEVFKYPFTYISEPGEMNLNDQEIVNLREYVDRGGFIMIDDFGGQRDQGEFPRFKANMDRAFPDREMFVLTDDHPLLNAFYSIDSIETVHPMTGVKSVFYGFKNKMGELAMVICFANDVGDYWEFIDEPRYAVRPSAEALKLGINFVMYSMTH